MLDREVIKEFLVAEFEDIEPIPKKVNLDKLAEDFSIYVENDFYEWLKDNFKSYFGDKINWNNINKKLINNPTNPI